MKVRSNNLLVNFKVRESFTVPQLWGTVKLKFYRPSISRNGKVSKRNFWICLKCFKIRSFLSIVCYIAISFTKRSTRKMQSNSCEKKSSKKNSWRFVQSCKNIVCPKGLGTGLGSIFKTWTEIFVVLLQDSTSANANDETTACKQQQQQQ